MPTRKHPVKTAALFSLLVFMIMCSTILVTLMLTLLLYHLGILSDHSNRFGLGIFASSTIIVGTILSRLAGRLALSTITDISNATKEVAQGNFETQLDETRIRGDELQTMAHNFNLMTRQLSRTELMRNDFIENVSHEFKTPISAIEGYATLLQNQNISEERRLEYSQKILLSTKRLSSLTGNILLLSRLENQELAVQKESFSLDEQIRETILLAEQNWSSRQIELDIELDTVDFYGNRELLAQVWQNIFGNALKFTPNGGLIRIELFSREDSVCVYIADNGRGMDSETLSRIYEKFFQGDRSRATSGNGLGLTLAKRIVDLHEGKISVESTPGQGTTFSVTLPLLKD